MKGSRSRGNCGNCGGCHQTRGFRSFSLQGGINCTVGSPRKFFTTFLRQKVQHFNVSHQNCFNFCMLTFPNAPLRFMFLLTHSGSLWLTLTQSGSLWLSLWLSQALIGSQGPCSAHHVVAAWPQFIPPCLYKYMFNNLFVIMLHYYHTI